MPDEPATPETRSGRGTAKHYVERKWRGLDNFQCNVGECIWDSFDEADMPIHWETVHGPNAQVVPPPSPASAPPIR